MSENEREILEDVLVDEGGGDLEWRCLTCGASAPPTPRDYMILIHHACTGQRVVRLIDTDTGEEMASNAKQALSMGLIRKGGDGAREEVLDEVGEVPETVTKAKGEAKELLDPQISSEGVFRYTIELPADAFALFNIAKGAGLETDREKTFDVWVWDCIRARFRKDYKRQLVLAGIEED